MIEVQLVGATRVRSGERVLQGRDFGGGKPRQLLEVLALNVGTPVSKDRIAELLWDGAPPASYLTTLEGYVSLLRGRLQPGVATRSSVVRTVQGGYELDAEQVCVDAQAVRDLVLRARTSSPARSLALLREALALGNGELLASAADATWAGQARHAHLRLLVEAGTRAARQALEVGEADLAVTLADQVLDRDPMAEEACRCAMQALGEQGRAAEALRRHGALRAVLADELGVDPAPATQALMTALLRDEPAPVLPLQRRNSDGRRTGDPHGRVDALTGALLTALRQGAHQVRGRDDDPHLIALLEGVLQHLAVGTGAPGAVIAA